MSEKYGIKTVVGGFGVSVPADEIIPFTLARTYYEHKALREIFEMMYGRESKSLISSALEVGAGYGRNLQVLKEFAKNVAGIERDQELCDIAERLNPNCAIYHGTIKDAEFTEKEFDLIMSFTFLQHLMNQDFVETMKEIGERCRVGGHILLCEETDPSKTNVDVAGRPIGFYESFLPKFDLRYVCPRVIEPTFRAQNSGSFMLFKRHRL